MNTWQLILRNVMQRKLSSGLTALSVALGVMLVVAILHLHHQTSRQFVDPGRGYSMVVGAPGSSLQLVLNTVFHMDESPGLMPIGVWAELEAHPSVRLAVPYALGDSFQGFPVVGTTDALFDARFPHPSGAGAEKLAAGRPLHSNRAALEHTLAALAVPDGSAHAGHDHDPDAIEWVNEAVVGAEVAAALDIRVGDQIEPTHGIESATVHAHEHLWTVVGVLERTSTPIDGVVFINLDSFYRIDDHAVGSLIPTTGEVGLSAVLLFPRGGMHKALVLSELKKRPDVQVADVNREVRHLMQLVGNIGALFLLVAVLVVIVALVSVSVSLYNAMLARQREVAVLRALGARRLVVVAVVCGEATLIATAGALGGLLGAHFLLAVLGERILKRWLGFDPTRSRFSAWSSPRLPPSSRPESWLGSCQPGGPTQPMS